MDVLINYGSIDRLGKNYWSLQALHGDGYSQPAFTQETNVGHNKTVWKIELNPHGKGCRYVSKLIGLQL